MALRTVYDKDNSLTVTMTFPDGDQDTVTWYVEDPAGTETTYVSGTDAEAVKTGTGIYTLTLRYNTSGDWDIRCSGVLSDVYTSREQTISIAFSDLTGAA